jgi:AcrR family transcriptional regulator
LLDAAEEVFGELSFDRASVAEITRRAGVAQGTFYVYFPDKKAAFTELVKVLNHDMRATIARAIEGLPDRLEMERTGFRVFFDYVSRHRALYKLVREAEFVDYDIYRWHYDTLGERYVRGIKQAIADGQLRADLDPVTVANILMGIAEFTGSYWVLDQGTPPPDEVLDQIMDFVSRGMGAS